MKLLINGKRYKLNIDGAKYVVNWNPEIVPDTPTLKLVALEYVVPDGFYDYENQETLSVPSDMDGISKVTINSGFRVDEFNIESVGDYDFVIPGFTPQSDDYNPIHQLLNSSEFNFEEDSSLVGGKIITKSNQVWSLIDILATNELSATTEEFFSEKFRTNLYEYDYILKFVRTGYNNYYTSVAYFGYDGNKLIGLGLVEGNGSTTYGITSSDFPLESTKLVLTSYCNGD